MFDPLRILVAVTAAASTAAVILFLCNLLWSRSRPTAVPLSCVLGVGLGSFLGCWILMGRLPHWPPREDQDRLLLLLLPAVIAVELAAAFPALPRGLAWLLRGAVAASTPRILLHGTSYLADLGLPGTPEWTPTQTWLILGGIALVQAATWVGLSLLAQRPSGRCVPPALIVACGGTGVTVMLSGYASGGQLGLPLAGALAGATVALLAIRRRVDMNGAIGPGVVGLFALLVVGHFFGNLPLWYAALLLSAPLLCWLPELTTRFAVLLRIICVVAPVSIVLVAAQVRFVEDMSRSSPPTTRPSNPSPPDTPEPTWQDYLDFRSKP